MTDDLERLAAELDELGARLRSGALEREEAAAAVERLAELAARLGGELDAAARAASREEAEGQERLL